MAPKLLNIAILGAGLFCHEQHLPAVQQEERVKLIAVYSRSLKSAKALIQGDGIEHYSDDSEKSLDDLLAREDLDAVIVALPINKQPEVIKKALDAGKHVLSEKPIAKDVEAAEDLISYASPLKPLWGVAENFRYFASYEKARDLGRTMGKISTFNFHLFGSIEAGNKYYETEWRKVPDYQGGFILDGGVHFISGFRKALDQKIVKVSAFSKLNRPFLPPVDTLNGLLQLEDGTSGTFSITFAATASGNKGVIQYEKGYIEGTVNSVSAKYTDDKVEGVEWQDDGSKAPVCLELADFVSSIQAGKLSESLSPEEALMDLRLIEELLLSAEQGGVPRSISH